MNKIKEWNRENLKPFHADIKAALQKIADQHGVSFLQKTGGTFTRADVSWKFTFVVQATNENGESISPERMEFEENIKWFGLKKEDWNREFIYGGEAYRVCGLKARRQRFPLCGIRVKDGRKFKFPLEVLGAKAHMDGVKDAIYLN